MSRNGSRSLLFAAALCLVSLFAAACGSDDTTDVATAGAGATSSQPGDDGTSGADSGDPEDSGDAGDAPIPVEPDGGIGDGAEPLPGAEEPENTGTWHGAQVAETNCPGIEWKRVEASEFSFSVPVDFVESDVQPIDSEIGVWVGGNNIEVVFDYGWYSGSISGMDGAENEPIDYSGVVGEQTLLRSENQIGVYFGEVNVLDGQSNKLSMLVTYNDPNDEIIGRCIVGSIDWKS